MRTGEPTPPAAPPESPAAPGLAAVYRNGTILPAAPTTPAAPAPDADGSPAPADLLPPPGRWERVAWYAGTVALTCLLLVAGLRLYDLDLHAPFNYGDDSLLIMPMVKATLERGFGGHWRVERMGYPGILELHDFPVVDHLHFAVIWLLGRVFSDWALVFNLYFLLTWPLAALATMAVLRRLKLTLPMAAAGGILYAFLPYHYLRGESHYFLAAYWVVPLSLLPALALCKGDFPFFRRDLAGAYRPSLLRRETPWQLLLGAATASAGAYYAFFACAIYGFVGAYGWVRFRTWKAAAAAAGLIALVGAFGVVNHLPALRYVAEYGKNSVTERTPEEAEIYGLKIAHLVLPIDGHNLTYFGQLKAMYNSDLRPMNNENSCAALGLIGAAGLTGLLAALVLPVRRVWPYAPLSALAGFLVVFALIGGVGSVFNLLVFDQVRCHNRVSVYLAFVCLFAALWPLDRFLVTRAGWARRLRYPAVAGLVALGVADQTPTAWFGRGIVDITDYDAERFRADRRFFARIEEAMPPGAKVFCLPYLMYPESPPLHRMKCYEHARGYLHTNTLVWGYGAMKHRVVDNWYEDVSHDARDQLLRRLVVRGFEGLFVDKRGFLVTTRNEGDAMIADLRRAAEGNNRVKLPAVVHEDGEQEFLDLRPYRDWLRAENPLQFEAWAKEEREWATITWLAGFSNRGGAGERVTHHWGYRRATAVVVNPSDRARRFEFSAGFGVESDGEFRIRIDGGGLVQIDKTGGPGPWADEFALVKQEWAWGPARSPAVHTRSYVIEVPPGRHAVTFRCTTPPKFMPSDSKPSCYYVKNVRFEEVEPK